MLCNHRVIGNSEAAGRSWILQLFFAQSGLAKAFLPCVFQNSNVENLPPHVLRLVYKEVSALAADPPEGIKVYPSEEDITELHTSIEGPGKGRSWNRQSLHFVSRTLKTPLKSWVFFKYPHDQSPFSTT